MYSPYIMYIHACQIQYIVKGVLPSLVMLIRVTILGNPWSIVIFTANLLSFSKFFRMLIFKSW